MEIAFVSANRLQIELDKQNGKLGGRIFGFFGKKPSNFITSMLLGNNIAMVVYGIGMGMLLEPVLSSYIPSSLFALLLQTIFSTLVILITAEFLPKMLFRINPNRTLSIFSVPVLVIYYVLYPISSFVTWISTAIISKLFKTEEEVTAQEFGRVDLDNFVREVADNIQEDHEIENEIQILKNALDFTNVKIRECMVPRNELTALDISDSIDELKQTFIETGLSKVLVYRETIDNIIGYVHSSELFKRPKAIKNALLPVGIAPESMLASVALENFIKDKRSIIVVVDEYGGTAGIVTIEDVIEEIFGEIEDEHDKEELIENQVDDDLFQFSARLEVDYLNENYDFEIPDSSDYETLAGYIISISERIPEQDEVIETDRFSFSILHESDSRIELVEMRVKSVD